MEFADLGVLPENGTWHVALYLQGVLCQDKEISTSFDPKTSELAIGRSTSGSYLCSGKIRAIRIREGALYNGQSFTPDEFPYQEPQTVGEWSKLNKSNLVLKSDLPSPKEDIVFTSTSLSNSKLIVENATVGTFAILDNSNSLVIPNMKQVGTSVEVDFTGWTVTGNWTIKFVSNTSVSGGGGGVTKDEATSIAIEAAIIFG